MTAKKDITVWKAVSYIIADPTKLNGKSFSGIIRGIECSGNISIERGVMFFCTDDPFVDNNLRDCTDDPYLDDESCNNTFGHAHSYAMDRGVDVATIKVGDDETPLKQYLDNALRTVYQNVHVKIGETYESTLKRENVILCNCSEVTHGLHSYANSEDIFEKHNYVGDAVAKCVIPKGSKYYVGTFDGCKSYASDHLRYARIID